MLNLLACFTLKVKYIISATSQAESTVIIEGEESTRPCNEVGSQNPADHLVGFKPGSFWK